jgi:sarcosine oxidase, subunit alpha
MNPRRLPPIPGEWIDRTQLIEFFFEGNRFTGYSGDTISSALWAGGQRILGRSFKYHRPRGILSLANHDINALMQDGSRLNVRADVTELKPEMRLESVNTVGGVSRDRASVLGFFSAFLPVGFYYKVFHNKQLFPVWERLIRSITGLGKIDVSTPRIRTPKQYDFCDVLVVGAGVSGLSAALAAANAGAEVVIVDENAQAGGSGHYQLGGDEAQREKVSSLLQALDAHPRIRLYTGTQAAAYYSDRWVPLIDQHRMIKMRSQAVIVATGAYEQPTVFRNNDRPGVLLSSAAQRLVYRYAVKPMNRAVVVTANTDGYKAAVDLLMHGTEIAAIIDLRQNYRVDQWTNVLLNHDVRIFTQHCIYEAKSNPANDGICAAIVCPFQDGKPQPGLSQSIACDGIVMATGWAPAANLLYQAGATMRFEDRLQQFVPDKLPDRVFACGRVNGVFEFKNKLQDGRRAGLAAVAAIAGQELPTVDVAPETEILSHAFPIVDHPKGKNFVDFDEDLQLKDFFNAAQEGFDNIELLKRYTTVGMGASQGKHSNMNALRILAKITRKTPGEVGTTTARPFFHPVPMSHLAGRGFTPERRTPLHDRHAELGAKFMPSGVWQRPEYYRQVGKKREECIRSEVKAVRDRVGIIDVGTLGKLEIRGPDAAEFLERVYTGRYQLMKVGTTRYALMLDEAGIVIDDGVIARLDVDQFYFTTTTSGATSIYRELSRLNTIWGLDCGLVNLTGARSAINLAGSYSREVLAKLTDLNLSGPAFPYLAVREATVAGIPAVLMRVGFVGEWGYEIHIATDYARALWDALLEVGRSDGICPVGVEAQRLLRLEKGHLIVGQDTDGLTTPIEANLQWAVKLDKPFFIGQRSLEIIAKRTIKQKLVGFTLDKNFNGSAPQECNLVIDQNEIAGRVTSISLSPTLNRYIGLAYVKPELSEIGQSFSVRLSDGAMITATVSKTPFYDPDNLRQKEETMMREESVV